MKTKLLLATTALLAGMTLAAAQNTPSRESDGGTRSKQSEPSQKTQGERQNQGQAQQDRQQGSAQSQRQERENRQGQADQGRQEHQQGSAQNPRQDRENRQGQAEPGRQDRQGNAQNQGQTRNDQRQGQAQPNPQEGQQGRAQNQGQNRDNQRQGQAQQGEGQRQGQTGRNEPAGSVTLTAEERSKIRQDIFSGSNVPRVDRANFAVRVGTVVPNDVRIDVVPETLIDIHPEWRGDQYFVVEDDVVIVDRDRHIVAVMPVGTSAAQREGSSRTSSLNINESEIREVQIKLNQKGFDVGQADGIMGPRTKDALTQFQREQGLQVSGNIDSATLDALGAAPSTTGEGGPSPSRNR